MQGTGAGNDGKIWDIKFYNAMTDVADAQPLEFFDAQIDDVVIFDEAITYFAVETLYDSGNHRPPSELQAPSFASHWELDGVGTDAQKLTSGVINAQPPTNPNTSTETVLKNVDVGQPAPDGSVSHSVDNDQTGAHSGVVSGMMFEAGHQLIGQAPTSITMNIKNILL